MVSDATRSIPLPAASVDGVLLANILHGFVANGEVEQVMETLLPVLKPDGRMVVIEFKKGETPAGPPQGIRLGSEDIARVLSPWHFRLQRTGEVGACHDAVELRRAAP